jgi:hypothetical protein
LAIVHIDYRYIYATAFPSVSRRSITCKQCVDEWPTHDERRGRSERTKDTVDVIADFDLRGGNDQRERRTETIKSDATTVNNNCVAAAAAAAGTVLCLELSYHSRLRPPVRVIVVFPCASRRPTSTIHFVASFGRVVDRHPNMCPATHRVRPAVGTLATRLDVGQKQCPKRIRSDLCRRISRQVIVRLNGRLLQSSINL